MKKLIYTFSFIIMLSLLASECGKEKIVTYPETGEYGDNILRESDIEVITYLDQSRAKYYSFAADVPKGNTLKIVMKNRTLWQTGINWSNIPDSTIGWTVENPEGISQTFTATGPAACDLQIRFFDKGNADIYFYENDGEEPVREKNISWKY